MHPLTPVYLVSLVGGAAAALTALAISRYRRRGFFIAAGLLAVAAVLSMWSYGIAHVPLVLGCLAAGFMSGTPSADPHQGRPSNGRRLRLGLMLGVALAAALATASTLGGTVASETRQETPAPVPVSATATPPPPDEHWPIPSEDWAIDELYYAVALEVPAFAGLYFDEGTLVVQVTDGNLESAAQARAKLIELDPTSGHLAESPMHANPVDYSWLQLYPWHRKLTTNTHSIAGFASSHIDVRHNRISVNQHDPHQEKASAREAADLAGIPPNAFIVE